MKPRVYVLLLSLFLFGSFIPASAQKKKNRVHEATPYADKALGLLQFTHPDSLRKAYDLYGQVIRLHQTYTTMAYCSRFAYEYRQDSLRKALETALLFTEAFPRVGDSWVYLGVIRMKQNDTSAARESFEKAVSLFEAAAQHFKEKYIKEQLQSKINLVQGFLGRPGPWHQINGRDKKGNSVSAAVYLVNVETVEKYAANYMSAHGLQFFNSFSIFQYRNH